MNFTDSPFEKMMKEAPSSPRPINRKPPTDPDCRGCPYWRGMSCLGICYRKLTGGARPTERRNNE